MVYQRRGFLGVLTGVSTAYLLQSGSSFQESVPVKSTDVPPEPPRAPVEIVGRQLFVDDYLIDSTSLDRTFHRPRLYENNPVMRPETELELHNGMCPTTIAEPAPSSITDMSIPLEAAITARPRASVAPICIQER